MPVKLPSEILQYEDKGLLLHPCKENKAPVFKGWQEIASAERIRHEEWFQEDKYKVGLLTGERNGIVVIDVDDLPQARELFETLRQYITAIAKTPRPGIHFYFKHPGEEIRNAVKTRIGNVLADIRADGGYVIAPPTYAWIPEFTLDMDKLETFNPRWVERKKEVSMSGEIRSPVKYIKSIHAVSGQHGHSSTFRAVCRLRDAGIAEVDALAIMIEWNKTNAEPPWTTKELLHKVRSAYARQEA